MSRDAVSTSESATRFGYFLVQARIDGVGEATQVDGVLENLATGEKRGFESAGDIGRLIGNWGQRLGGRPC